MGGNVQVISDSNFEQEILKSGIPAVVDFWAPWCGPCKQMGPLFEELSTAYAGKIKFAKMNVDENPVTPDQYHVRGIPNFIFLKNGELVEQLIGAVPRQQLTDTLDKLL